MSEEVKVVWSFKPSPEVVEGMRGLEDEVDAEGIELNRSAFINYAILCALVKRKLDRVKVLRKAVKKSQ